MGRPGFVLDVDERTPPLLVCDGAGFRLERFPLGTRVVYPAESLEPLEDVREAINAALDAPLDSEPLSDRLRPGMRLTIAFDDNTSPVPRMPRPDIRGRIIEAVLTRAAAAGVDDVQLICANGLNRRLTETELQRLLGERVFRSFFADGLLTNHDAEDAERLCTVGVSDFGDVQINSRAAGSDLLVFVHVVVGPRGGGPASVARGLGSTATIRQLAGTESLRSGDRAAAIGGVVAQAVPLFRIDAVLDNDVYAGGLEFLAKREWEWNIKERAGWLAIRQGLALTPARARRRLLSASVGGYHVVGVIAGAAEPVDASSRRQILAQQQVEVPGQADVAVIGVAHSSPYSIDSVTNPVLAAWSGLVGIFQSHTGRPVVREGGALILYHPMPAEFSPLHHPSYVDFFADVLSKTTDPDQLRGELEARYAEDPWYIHLYRTSLAFHGVHPFHAWYEIAAARAHCSDIVWVGADRDSVSRMGFRAASTFADALEIVSSSVGRSPRITYLHTPPQIVADVTS
jgi:hypothetical protein